MKLLIIIFILCSLWTCKGLVTKEMYKPRVGIEDFEIFENIRDFHAQSKAQNLPPVLCIPGVGGSQLSAKVHKASHWYCQKSSDYYLIWLQLTELVPGPLLDCWSADISLQYDQSSNQFTNATNVDIEPNFPGSTLGFEYLDPDARQESIYFASLVDALVQQGYVRGENLLGSPYDWRLSPSYYPSFFVSIQTMIEDLYSVNNSKVAIIAHSMGNLFFLTFLRQMSQQWKDQYILRYIAISPPWVGAATSVQSLTSGYDFSIPYLPPSDAKLVQRTFASTYFLLPYPKYYGDTVFITTPSRSYSANQYVDLFAALGLDDMYDPYLSSVELPNPYEPPGVDTFCLYGYNVTTVRGEVYNSEKFDKPKLIIGDGDGTVPIESLTFCQQWANNTNKTVIMKGYKGESHVDLLLYPPFISDVLSIIFKAVIPGYDKK